jgi:hypothetical protein
MRRDVIHADGLPALFETIPGVLTVTACFTVVAGLTFTETFPDAVMDAFRRSFLTSEHASPFSFAGATPDAHTFSDPVR